MLSFNKGRPLAKIKGGEFNNRIVYVRGDNNVCCNRCSEKCCRGKRCCRKCERCCDITEEFDKIKLEEGRMRPLPNVDTREILSINGPSGSGKSTFAANYVEVYNKLLPQLPIYLFSRKDNDPPLDKLNPIRVPIDENLINNPIDVLTEFPGGAILIFDDVTTIYDDKLKKAVEKLMMDAMEVGRSAEVYLVITNHLVIPNEKKFARTIMNELQALTIFPKSGSSQQISYALKNYFGFNKQQIEKILNLPSRWVTVYKTYPQCVVYEKGCYIP